MKALFLQLVVPSQRPSGPAVAPRVGTWAPLPKAFGCGQRWLSPPAPICPQEGPHVAAIWHLFHRGLHCLVTWESQAPYPLLDWRSDLLGARWLSDQGGSLPGRLGALATLLWRGGCPQVLKGLDA